MNSLLVLLCLLIFLDFCVFFWGEQDSACGRRFSTRGTPHPPSRRAKDAFFCLCFRWVFESPFPPLGSTLHPSLPPKPTKIHQKSMLRGNSTWASSFNQFLIDFWCQLRPPKLKTSSRNQLFFFSFFTIDLSKLASIFDPILVPTRLHYPSENPPNMHQN